jgi:serine/threonine protein kinase
MELGAIIKDQYQVVEHIGRGGMADVWSARDTRLRRMVAIKTIAHGLTQDVDPVQLFEREAQTIARMEHPHILPIYDFGEYDNSLYIVMRYVTGGSLEDRIRGGGMEPREVLRIGRSIAQALDYAHQNNVIHLDLKPPNILLDSSQTPYLADFGLATVLDPEGRAHNPGSGTLLYMAPEQLVAEVIDHRADIYSFAIMLYHMFTGQLPFGGTQPLALKQMQANDYLPDDIIEYNENLPYEVVEILREGTAEKPDHRPSTLLEIIDKLQDAIFGASTSEVTFDPLADLVPDSSSALTNSLIKSGDDTLLEAVDIYTRARHVWAGGQGRFLLGLTHFMLMSDYYAEAVSHGLSVDEAGHQMLLRGALEYDYELDHWWQNVSQDEQRLVALHTLRTGTASARIRALHRLEALPDDAANPIIPKLIGQALEVESDEEAQLTALQVLRTRARLLKPHQSIEIATQYRGRLLTTATRLGIQVLPPSLWQEAVYSPEIDLLIANSCFDEDSPKVAEYAARTIGQIRSLTGVRFLAKEQRAGRTGALQALAYVRDESPALPDVVSRQGRFYAWLTNTLRRLTDNPLEGILRFVLALIGGWIGMGQIIYTTYRSQSLFTPQRWGNTLAIGLVFGLFVALTVSISDEFSARLRGFWSWWLRLLVFGALGFLMGVLTWAGFTWMYLQYIPLWDIMRLAGFALASGFVLTALLGIYGWRSLIFITLINFVAVSALHQSFYATSDFSVTWVAPLGWVTGGLLGWLAARRTQLVDHIDLPGSTPVRIILATVLGIAWVALVWLVYGLTYQASAQGTALTWDGVLALFVGAMLASGLLMYWLKPLTRFTVMAASLAGFVAVYASVGWVFSDQILMLPTLTSVPLSVVYLAGVPFAPPAETPLIYFDNAMLMPQIVLPMLFVIALGANGIALWRGWWRFAGKPYHAHERNAWATGGLWYMFIISTMVSVLALFSAHNDIAWALVWSAGGFITFVATVATWRWAKWGGRLLVAMLIAWLVGGFLFDLRDIGNTLALGEMPALFAPMEGWGGQFPVAIWTIVGLWVAVFVWGALRRKLWGGIGLLAFIPIWFALRLFTPIVPSIAMLSLIHVAFFAFVLQNIWGELEPHRLRNLQAHIAQADEVAMQGTSLTTQDTSLTAQDTQEIGDSSQPDMDTKQRTGIAEHTATPMTQLGDAQIPTEQSQLKDADIPATELDPVAYIDEIVDAGEEETEDEAQEMAQSPRIKLNTGKLDAPQTELDPQASPSIKLNTGRTPATSIGKSGESSSSAPRIKIGGDDSKPRIKLNTGRTPATSIGKSGESSSSAPRIKIGGDDSKPRIKLDTGKLGTPRTQLDARQANPTQSQDDDTGDEDQTPNDVPEDTTDETPKDE